MLVFEIFISVLRKLTYIYNISLCVNSLDMKLRATTLLNSRLQEMDQIITMTVIYILIICEGVAPYMRYFCPIFVLYFFWTKICLIRLWPCYIIGFCSFNVWSVSIDKDCLEVANTHFDYSAWLFSSRRKPYIHLFFFQMKVFRKLGPIFDTRHVYESQISPVAPSWFFCCFFFSSFIFQFFFSRKNWLLPKTPLLLFFRFSSFFQNWFHAMSSVFIVATSQKTDDPC